MKKVIKISNLIQNGQPLFIYFAEKSSSIITYDSHLWHLRGRYISVANTTISTKFTSRCVFCTVNIRFAVHIRIVMVIIACGTHGYDRYDSIVSLTRDKHDRYDSIIWLTRGCDGYRVRNACKIHNTKIKQNIPLD